MKTFTRALLGFVLIASVSSSPASVAKKIYSGFYKGQPCTVRITWSNWEGLGPLTGMLRTAAGTTVAFTGTNSQPGVIELSAGGESMRLTRRDVGKAATWTGSRLTFSEAPAASPTPTPTPSPSPATEEVLTPEEQMPPPRMVDESYTGSWRGEQLTAQMRWAPGDDPQIIRRGRGTITTASGQKFSIEGTQSSADAAEFSITPDSTGETYKTTKATHDGNQSWEGSTLTLKQTK